MSDQPAGDPATGGVAEGRRAAIVASAERLVAVHGFDALRLRDVARDAGVSIGLIQHYFDTRDDLLLQTVREASRRRVQAWTALATDAGTGPTSLTALLAGAVSDAHRCAVWLETCAAASRHEALRADVATTQDAWRAVLAAAVAEGIAAGDLEPTLEADEVVDALVCLIDGVMLAVASEGDDPERHAARTRVLLRAADRLLRPTGAPR